MKIKVSDTYLNFVRSLKNQANSEYCFFSVFFSLFSFSLFITELRPCCDDGASVVSKQGKISHRRKL